MTNPGKLKEYRAKCLDGVSHGLERSRKMEGGRPIKLLLGRFGQLKLNFENKEMT